MNTSINYSKGSEWRKWDLHVHTPYSIVNNYEGKSEEEKWDKYIEAIENLPDEVKVIGITDYYFIDGYEKVMSYKLKNRLQNIDKIFPILEFRIDTFSSGNENNLQKINLHILFNINESDLENEVKKIKEEFISLIPLTKLEKHKTKILSKKNFIDEGGDLQKGFSNLIPPTDKVFELLNSATWKDKTFLFLGYKEWSNLEKNNQLRPFKEDLYQKVDAFFCSNFSTFEKNQKWLNEFGNKKLLHSGDIHDFNFLDTAEKDNEGKYISKNYKCYTWIKADPTFEGLKQIIYEPEERVRIQENNPEFDFDKPTFSKITITEPIEVFQNEKVKFDKNEIPLNKNLVTIIGGRGTGKSLLLNYIVNTFNKTILAYDKEENKTVKFNDSEKFIIEWQKNNIPFPEKISFDSKNKGELDFIFIEQSKLKNISDYKTLSKEIKKLLKIEDLQFDKNIDIEIINLLEEIKKIKDWFNSENENGIKINNKKFNESKKENAKNLLDTITTEENKQKLESYTSNIKKISHCNNILSKLKKLKEDFGRYQKDTNEIINNINADIQDDLQDIKIPSINFEEQLKIMIEIESKLNEIIQSKIVENDTIKNEFEKQGYKGDLKTLLDNAEKYQKDIQEAENKLREIEKQEELLIEKIKKRNDLSERLKSEYERQKNEIEKAWKNLLEKFSDEQQKKIIEKLLKDKGITFEGEIYFDINTFDEKIREYLDLRTYRNLSKDLGIESLDNYWEFIKNQLSEYIEGEKEETTKKPLDELFFNLKERKDYLYVIPKIKYKDKTLNQLSVGQRGTLYLLLQLATNAFSSPLIFDQPEDDLDNEFITKELVDLIKELKKYRQIIISTHNANLVVTADAEQVIVASNENECLSYVSGSLENKAIIENVCRILEGGKAAFEKRKYKYGVK